MAMTAPASVSDDHRIDIRASNITGGGFGAFTLVPRKKGELLGTYAGEPLTDAEYLSRYGDSPVGAAGYCLIIRKNLTLDARDPKKSNWIRYVNSPARTKFKANVKFSVGGTLRALCDIDAGVELFVGYGNSYRWAV
jgi:hypothetical protein